MSEIEVPTLLTERLRLRPLCRGDIGDYAALKADPEVMRHLGGPWDRGRSWRHLAFLVGHWYLGDAGMWALVHRDSGAFAGVLGFAEPEGWPGFELAGSLKRSFWGHGYATEGARAALAYAFTVLHKDRVISLVRPDNGASRRLVERLGQSVQGRTSVQETEYLVYGIDRESYAAAKRAQESRERSGQRPGRTAEGGNFAETWSPGPPRPADVARAAVLTANCGRPPQACAATRLPGRGAAAGEPGAAYPGTAGAGPT